MQDDRTPRGERIPIFCSLAQIHRDRGARVRLHDREGLLYAERVLRYDPCSYCGAKVSGTVDHIDPVRPDGLVNDDDTASNLTAACRSCNSRKSTRTLLMFLAARAGVVEAMTQRERRLHKEKAA